MNKRLRSSDDGTINATLGKRLERVIRITGAELKGEPYLLGIEIKEITFNIIPSSLNLYLDKIQEDRRLTITDKMSMEADAYGAWIDAPSAADEDVFEIWLWD